MYYIQIRNIAAARFERDSDEGPFETILEALERRDEIAANWPNDGLRSRRDWRVVDDEGTIYEYETRYVTPG